LNKIPLHKILCKFSVLKKELAWLV